MSRPHSALTETSSRDRKVRHFQRGAFTVLGCAAMTGCWEAAPCDPGQIVRLDQCVVAPAASVPASDGGGDASNDAAATEGGGDEGVMDTFGKTCATAADCAGGNATVCAAPQLPICTQILCQAGEANAGVCPPGWQCLVFAPNPSVCLKP